MNKKILAKTLLPIATVALLGGGIASSIVLNSCSEGTNESIILTVNNYEEYLANHVVKCEEEYFTTNSDYEINLVDDFFVWLSHNYTKQVFVNGIIGTAFAGTILVPYATTVTVEIKSDSIIVVEKTETQTNIQKYVFEKWNGFNDHVINLYGNFPYPSYTMHPDASFEIIKFEQIKSTPIIPSVILLYPTSSGDSLAPYYVAQTDLTDLHIRTPPPVPPLNS